MANIKVIEDKNLSSFYDKRYVVVDKDTGELLDNAQGYGYKTIKNAYSAYAYKNRDKSKDKEKAIKNKKIKSWMKKHKGFISLMDEVAFQIAKGSYGSNAKFNSSVIKSMLKENNLEIDFTPSELLKVWERS